MSLSNFYFEINESLREEEEGSYCGCGPSAWQHWDCSQRQRPVHAPGEGAVAVCLLPMPPVVHFFCPGACVPLRGPGADRCN